MKFIGKKLLLVRNSTILNSYAFRFIKDAANIIMKKIKNVTPQGKETISLLNNKAETKNPSIEISANAFETGCFLIFVY